MPEKIEVSVNSQRRLVADASHELRTPITSIRTNIDLLASGRPLADGDRERMMRDVTDQLEELTTILNDLVELARDGELESSPVRIDNTPPLVTLTREGEGIIARAVDQTSPLRRCDMSMDARPWVVVEAEDGVTDGREEVFRMRLQNLSGGEHLVTVRVTDAAGNPGLAKLVIR